MKQVVFASVLALGLSAAVAAQTPAPSVELKVGDKAPDFTLPGTDGKAHKLSDYKGKTVVLAWYPAAFTGGCTRECKSFASSGEMIKKFDVVYFMASVDDEAKNKDFAAQENADFPMLSDPDRKVAMAYGVVNSPTGRAMRWTFYIGADGKILFIDKTVNQHLDDAGQVLAAKLDELQVKKVK
jgi:peroxiredoxin Q/BCP